MRKIAHFDAARFGSDIQRKLGEAGLSYRQLTRRCEWVSHSAISRAVNAKPLSVANFLGVCRAFDLDPKAYFSVKNQTVSVPVSRETEAGEAGRRARVSVQTRAGEAGRRARGAKQTRGGIGAILAGLK